MSKWICSKCFEENKLRSEEAMIMIPIKGVDYCWFCGWHPKEKRFIVDEHGRPL